MPIPAGLQVEISAIAGDSALSDDRPGSSIEGPAKARRRSAGGWLFSDDQVVQEPVADLGGEGRDTLGLRVSRQVMLRERR
jgi:hypothetical protein